MSSSGASRGGASIGRGTAAARPGTPATDFWWATDTAELSVASPALTTWNGQAQVTPGGHVFSVAGNSSIGTSGGTNTLGSGITQLYTPTAAPVYSASITPNALTGGTWQTITVTNASAFTINAPATPPGGGQTQALTIEIFNNSGGAMGVITWNGAFKLVGGAFTNPANTFRRFIRFEWNGANWIETSRAGADY